jgi:hypothetical protein
LFPTSTPFYDGWFVQADVRRFLLGSQSSSVIIQAHELSEERAWRTRISDEHFDEMLCEGRFNLE